MRRALLATWNQRAAVERLDASRRRPQSRRLLTLHGTDSGRLTPISMESWGKESESCGRGRARDDTPAGIFEATEQASPA